MLRPLLVLCLALLLPMSAVARLAGPPEVARPAAARDLASIRGSGELRVLVNQSRNSSGEIKGQSIGVEYHRLRAFEQYLNRDAGEGRRVRLKLIPKAKDQLVGALQRGEGDLVAPGELLDTRGSHISASAAIRRNVPVIIVGRKGDRRYQRFEQMAGRSLALPTGSVAGEAVRQINQELQLRKLAPIIIEWVDPTLAIEDVLEMVQAGIFSMTAVEQPIAERWAKVMPRLRLEPALVLTREGDMRWYLRRDTPMLGSAIDRFLAGYRAPSDQDAAFQRVYRRLYKVHSPLGRAERQRLEKVRPVLQRYAQLHDFDWLALAAVAFKESTLNPAARGAGGATGLMQITPAAARSVGVSNIGVLENNVQASAKYLAMIRRNFFNSPQLNERERMAFVLAGYNMGPQRVQSMRAEARRRGLNPNQWFFQVERIAMEQVGMGVVSYVNAVNKYYLAYDRERYGLETQSLSFNTRK
ncbi:MAG: transglycosylase SLT domain-containing protein [Gammaproteobacteria bacterium]|nr:transglycosylase SLT domain-containing protein [Gammaproteobacteria bacterium]MBU1489777.1 transglycosylase SLT domain-containing protein [Gammaproteobacteria bacterium]MBU2067696.1 transglycosylase SLT domain-containing protein [Gammaproteobacteria bacterium]MBU2138303.1 transglycosylase SLT domain-containing protein [Gammaproteobacteria bacterium]MBU2218449.1 transglycosylase SLT domain-containing protein [Gammaproteobacteria bacterium]